MRTRMWWQLLVVVVLSVAACSGGAESEPARTSGAPAGQAGQGGAAPAPSPEAKLRAAQESAVQAMCERLVDCAVDQAKASMSPDEVAKLELDKTGPQLRAECEEEGMQNALSPRQVTVIQRCVNQDGTCDQLNACLDEAKKRD